MHSLFQEGGHWSKVAHLRTKSSDTKGVADIDLGPEILTILIEVY